MIPADAGQDTGGADPALGGMRVLELGGFIAGPGASLILGDLGAEVIKVEPPAGEPTRATGAQGECLPGDGIFYGYNRGKRSIALDLRRPEGLAVFRRLLASADVLIQNLRPGSMEALGLGEAALRAIHPGLVYASISGFGVHGPFGTRPGFDIAAQAESGMMSVNGQADGPPTKVGFSLVDTATAHVTAQAVLAALLRRARTGQGDTVRVSLLEVALHLQGALWSSYALSDYRDEPQRCGNMQPHVAPAADLIRVADGEIVLSTYLPRHFAALCEALRQPALASDPRFASNERRVANRPALLRIIADALAGSSMDQCVQLLEPHGIVVGAVRSYAQARRSAAVEATGMFISVPTPDGSGSYETLRTPWSAQHALRAKTGRAPRLGEHSVDILAQCGHSEAEIGALLKAGIVLEEAQRAEASP